MKRSTYRVLTALLAAVLTACSPTPKEKKVIADFASQMKPVCMGRFVMAVPQTMRFGGSVTLYYGLDIDYKTVDVGIESLDDTPEAMRNQMDSMAKDIDQDDKNWETKKSMLLDYKVINDRMIYLRKQRATESAAASDHELHVLVEKTQLVLRARSYEGVSGIQEFSPGFKVETPDQVAARLYKIAGEIRAYDTPEDAGPGFCLGPVVIDSDNDEESPSMFLKTPRHPDLLMRVYSKALTPDGEDKPLLERIAKLSQGYDIDVLRKGGVRLAGMQGQEWLAKAKDEQDKNVLMFQAESMRTDPALTRPFLSIQLDIGGQIPFSNEHVDASLTPREATALWDAMVSSIRVRPNAVRPKTND